MGSSPIREDRIPRHNIVVPCAKRTFTVRGDMPIVRATNGRSIFVSVEQLFLGEYPEDILRNNAEYQRRLKEAKYRILEVIRYAAVPLSGRGTCHEVHGIGPRAEHLAEFVDLRDGRRAELLKKQRKLEKAGRLPAGERRRKSPQRISRRRSALFSGTDIPDGYFRSKYNCHVGREERGRFVDLMRRQLFESAIISMYAADELVRLNDVWYVKVSIMDVHPGARRGRRHKSAASSKRTKTDDRSFHGKPNRDRKHHVA